MNTATKINMKFDEYMERFFYRTARRALSVEESEPIKKESSELIDNSIVIRKRPAAVKAELNKAYKVIRCHVMANKKDLLSRRHELSEEQNQVLDHFLYREWLVSNRDVAVEESSPPVTVVAKPSIDLLASHSEPVIVKQEDPKDVQRWARAALSNRSDSQRVVDRYIKENKKELLARRHELSAEQNEAIDIFLRLEALAGNE